MKREVDPGIDTDKKNSAQISAECGHDTKRIGDHLHKLEKNTPIASEPGLVKLESKRRTEVKVINK
ncbi:MAG: hypothetical protein IPK58_21120 [Acidobacteria bacterium]|nr:hypothetical protein [Acidobacteriota bacterium]